MRRRDTLLEAMLVFRTLHPRISFNEIVAFLYTCENEGLSVQELAFITGMSQSAASRNLRALGSAGTPWALPPGLGLIEPFLSTTDGRSHVLMLSEAGQSLRDQLDQIIGEAWPIKLAKV